MRQRQHHKERSGSRRVTSRLRLSLLGAGAHYTTVGMAFPLLLLQAEALGGARAAGLVLGLPMLVFTFASPFWGWLADRWRSRRRVVLLCAVASAVLFVPQPWLATYELLALRLLQSFFLGGMVHLATLFSELDPRARGHHLGTLNAVSSLAWGLGGLFTGLLVAGGDYGRGSPPVIRAFMLCTALGVVGVAGLLALPERRVDETVVPHEPLRGLSRLWIATVLLFAGYYVFLTFAPDFLSDQLGSTRSMGLVFAAAGVAGAVLAPWIGRLCDRMPRLMALRIVYGLYIGCMIIYTLAPHPLIVAAAFVPPVWVLFQVAATALVADHVPYRLRGRAVGLLNAALFLGGGLGGLLAAALGESLALAPLFALGTALVTLGTLVGWWLPEPSIASAGVSDE